MTRSVLQLVAAILLMLVGAWLIGWWAVGVLLVLFGALVGADAVLRDDVVDVSDKKQQLHNQVLEWWRRAQ